MRNRKLYRPDACRWRRILHCVREQAETLPWPPTSNDIPDFVEVLVRAGVEGAEIVSAASIVAKVDPPVVALSYVCSLFLAKLRSLDR